MANFNSLMGISLHNPKLSFRASPNILSPLFSEYVRNGNLDDKFFDLLNEDKLEVKHEDSISRHRKYVQLTEELIKHVDMKLRTVEFYRSPPPGIYINSYK